MLRVQEITSKVKQRVRKKTLNPLKIEIMLSFTDTPFLKLKLIKIS